MTATFDSNIWVSAVTLPAGRARQAVDLAVDEKVKVAISDVILVETVGVLRNKFGTSESGIAQATSLITACTIRVVPTRTINAVPSDPDDNRILECAVESKSDYIVTGDKDLLRLGQFEGIRIVSLPEFLELHSR